MNEVVLLDERHGADLYHFLIKYKDTGGLQLLQKRGIFLSSQGSAIACLENKVLKQLLLCEFKDGICFTRSLNGDFGEHTIEVLDILCAVCSSRSPIISDHHMVIQPTHIEGFKQIWHKTRLGQMASNESWSGMIFRAKINYPIV